MKKKYNVIFMVADDHRGSEINLLYNTLVQTPVLDNLIRNGAAFKNMHIMGGWHKAVCAPSRACILTGGNVYHAVSHEPEPKFDDIMKNHCNINQDLDLLPEVLKKNGYYTYAVGKWHNDKASFHRSFNNGGALFFGGMADPESTPLHSFKENGLYPPEEAKISKKFATEIFCDEGVNFINSYDQDSPFFLYIAFTSPHDPRHAPENFRKLYDAQKIPLPKNFQFVHPFDNGEMHVRDEGLASLPRVPQEICQQIADYYSMISHMDAQMGRIINAVSNKGIDDETIIIYTSDHGLAMGQHGLIGKQNLYDHSIKIPFLIKSPNIESNQVINALTCQMDILPTICDLTGIEIPGSADGKSLAPLMEGKVEKVYDSVFSAYKDLQRMIRKDKWKLIRYYYSNYSSTGSDRIQLFNIEEDPWEMNNLALDPVYFDVVNELIQELEQWQKRVKDPLLLTKGEFKKPYYTN